MYLKKFESERERELITVKVELRKFEELGKEVVEVVEIAAILKKLLEKCKITKTNNKQLKKNLKYLNNNVIICINYIIGRFCDTFN